MQTDKSELGERTLAGFNLMPVAETETRVAGELLQSAENQFRRLSTRFTNNEARQMI